MKSLIVVACVIAVLVTSATELTVAVQRGAPEAAERTKAMLSDARVKTFMTLVKSNEIGGKCDLPDAAKSQARLRPQPPPPPGAPPGFLSFVYEIGFPCAGNNGLSAVLIAAEFAPPNPAPLNMTLSLEYSR